MKNRFVEIPHEQIEPETLRELVEEFITRDGTFYGEKEMSMEQKIDMVIGQLKSREAVITWDRYVQTSNIALRKDIDKQND
mgnify:CR=1|jgi:uncharacterized protein